MRGGNVIYFPKTMNVQLQGAMPARATKAPTGKNIVDFFAHFGVRVQSDMVKDYGNHLTSSRFSIPQVGFHYPYLNVSAHQNGDLSSEGIFDNTPFYLSLWPSSLKKSGDTKNVKIQFFARSSKQAEQDSSPYGVILHQQQLAQMDASGAPKPPNMPKGKKGQYNLAALITPKIDKKFESFFTKDKIPEGVIKVKHLTEATEEGLGMILIVSSVNGVSDYMNWVEPQPPIHVNPQTRKITWYTGQYLKLNIAVVESVIDKMLGKTTSSDLRVKQDNITTFSKTSGSEATLYSLLNLLIMPFSLGGIGLFRYIRLRKRQREYELSLREEK